MHIFPPLSKGIMKQSMVHPLENCRSKWSLSLFHFNSSVFPTIEGLMVTIVAPHCNRFLKCLLAQWLLSSYHLLLFLFLLENHISWIVLGHHYLIIDLLNNHHLFLGTFNFFVGILRSRPNWVIMSQMLSLMPEKDLFELLSCLNESRAIRSHHVEHKS